MKQDMRRVVWYLPSYKLTQKYKILTDDIRRVWCLTELSLCVHILLKEEQLMVEESLSSTLRALGWLQIFYKRLSLLPSSNSWLLQWGSRNMCEAECKLLSSICKLSLLVIFHLLPIEHFLSRKTNFSFSSLIFVHKERVNGWSGWS